MISEGRTSQPAFQSDWIRQRSRCVISFAVINWTGYIVVKPFNFLSYKCYLRLSTVTFHFLLSNEYAFTSMMIAFRFVAHHRLSVFKLALTILYFNDVYLHLINIFNSYFNKTSRILFLTNIPQYCYRNLLYFTKSTFCSEDARTVNTNQQAYTFDGSFTIKCATSCKTIKDFWFFVFSIL